jgi:O-antigen/teichoic acid export membrane protein
LYAFFVSIIGIVTGLIFILIITRNLSPEEFGTWSLIGSIIGYVMISESIINFWTTREIARGKNIGKTSLLSNIGISFGLIPIYLVISSVLTNETNALTSSMYFGLILVPVTFISQALNAINLGFKPENTSKSLLTFEIAKVPVALLFVYFLELGLEGTILAVFIAFLIKLIIQIYLTFNKIKGDFHKNLVIRWFKFSWISLYKSLPTLLSTLDIALYLVITSSVIGIAYYTASFTIANLVKHTGNISQALYTKLLAKGNLDHIKENISLQLFFGIPLVGISVLFSKPALYALNPIYSDAYIVVIFLAIKSLFFILSQTFQVILLGIEKVDLIEKPKFSNLLHSYLFQIPSFRIIKLGIYLGILIPSLYLSFNSGMSEIELIILWSLISLLIEIPNFIFYLIIVKQKIGFVIPYTPVLKYVIGTGGMASVYFLTSPILITYHESIFNFLPELILQLILCVITYVGILYLIDSKTRNLVGAIINEVFYKKN